MEAASHPVLQEVRRALSLAHTAVSLDSHGKVDEAATCYHDVVDVLTTAATRVPTSTAEELRRVCDGYKQRLQALESTPAAAALSGERLLRRASLHLSKQFNPFAVLSQAEEQGLWRPPPPLEALRPYWLLEIVRHAIASGGIVSPGVYCAPEVWAQDHVPLVAPSHKEGAFNAAAALLKQLPHPNRPDYVMQFGTVVRHIVPQLHDIQSQLRSCMPSVPAPPTAGSMLQHRTRHGTGGSGGHGATGSGATGGAVAGATGSAHSGAFSAGSAGAGAGFGAGDSGSGGSGGLPGSGGLGSGAGSSGTGSGTGGGSSGSGGGGSGGGGGVSVGILGFSHKLRAWSAAMPAGKASGASVQAYAASIQALAAAARTAAVFVEQEHHNAQTAASAQRAAAAAVAAAAAAAPKDTLSPLVAATDPVARARAAQQAAAAAAAVHVPPSLALPITQFIQDAVCPVVIADMSVLLHTYLRRGHKELKEDLQ